jgi:hypothetical protein
MKAVVASPDDRSATYWIPDLVLSLRVCAVHPPGRAVDIPPVSSITTAQVYIYSANKFNDKLCIQLVVRRRDVLVVTELTVRSADCFCLVGYRNVIVLP